MNRVRFFFPEVRLKQLLEEPGGITVADALMRADDAIEANRDAGLRAIDDKIASIAAIEFEDCAGASNKCYALSNEIYAEAGMMRLSELSDVAHNLCELLSGVVDEGVSRRAIRVHIDAMRALRSPAASSSRELRRAVLEELHRLTARLSHH